MHHEEEAQAQQSFFVSLFNFVLEEVRTHVCSCRRSSWKSHLHMVSTPQHITMSGFGRLPVAHCSEHGMVWQTKAHAYS